MVRHSAVMCVLALALAGLSFYCLTLVPTGFIPNEDQGFLMVGVQLPDAASLGRTKSVLDDLSQRIRQVPGVDHTLAIGGVSVVDNSASLANTGVIYVILKDWSVRHEGQDLASIYKGLLRATDSVQSASSLVLLPPAIQGLGLSGGFQMMVELTDGSFDYRKLQSVTDRMVQNSKGEPTLARVATSFRATVPQIVANVDSVKAATAGVSVGSVYDTLQTYLGSTYVNQMTKFGHTFPVYLQADSPFRMTAEAVKAYYTRSPSGAMVPLGAIADISDSQGPALISLYNLYPASTLNGSAGEGFSSGQAIEVMAGVADATMPPGTARAWTGMSYQETLVGNTSYIVFGVSLLLVFLVLAGQYESWLAPAAVILAVPLALLGTAGVMLALGLANNIYTQVGLILLISLSAKNAILIVEHARDSRSKGEEILEAAVKAAHSRFRPILMTSFAFMLGVLPLITASGAGAAARKSIGIAVFSGMLASTCLAVLFVPSFFVVLQKWSERGRTKNS
jgi:HAE1 family hydrophobic/amphiphilic exporter-1